MFTGKFFKNGRVIIDLEADMANRECLLANDRASLKNEIKLG